ncbi:hypothetical protein K3495_g13357 [Podosphaera aphanis]|nr:hypothetical protein K3495_g13357 [Podosphaera aphanis]
MNIGLGGLTMNVADGTSAKLTHYSEFFIGILGIWRKIAAFFRPFAGKGSEEIHLLLGLPWFHAVDAKLRIKDSIIEIGDVTRGEVVTKIQGPKFMESDKYKLVLCPDNRSDQISMSDGDSSDDTEDSDEESESDDDSEDGDLSALFVGKSGKYSDLSKS